MTCLVQTTTINTEECMRIISLSAIALLAVSSAQDSATEAALDGLSGEALWTLKQNIGHLTVQQISAQSGNYKIEGARLGVPYTVNSTAEGRVISTEHARLPLDMSESSFSGPAFHPAASDGS